VGTAAWARYNARVWCVRCVRMSISRGHGIDLTCMLRNVSRGAPPSFYAVAQWMVGQNNKAPSGLLEGMGV
jgi:hypothetical protein